MAVRSQHINGPIPHDHANMLCLSVTVPLALLPRRQLVTDCGSDGEKRRQTEHLFRQEKSDRYEKEAARVAFQRRSRAGTRERGSLSTEQQYSVKKSRAGTRRRRQPGKLSQGEVGPVQEKEEA